MSGASGTLDAARTAAEAKGLVVVEPKPNELFVDIDDDASLVVFTEHVAAVKALLPGTTYRLRPSPSGTPGRFHATVVLSREVMTLERICLQALLGSDRLHELLSWVSYSNGNKTPTVFFERPEVKP